MSDRKCIKCNTDLLGQKVYYSKIYRVREYRLLPNNLWSSEPISTIEDYYCKQCKDKEKE